MTHAARPILKGEASITLRADSVARPVRKSAPKALVAEEDAPLLAVLKAQRRALAEAQKVPAYVIFTDRTLIEMAEKRPGTLDAMAGIGGVGTKKLERYGATFLEVISGQMTAPQHPARRALNGRDAGTVFDRLQEAQVDLARGEHGTDKPLSCNHATLRKIAESRPGSLEALGRIQGIGELKVDRFGDAFLAVLSEA